MHSDSWKELEQESGMCAGENLMRITEAFLVLTDHFWQAKCSVPSSLSAEHRPVLTVWKGIMIRSRRAMNIVNWECFIAHVLLWFPASLGQPSHGTWACRVTAALSPNAPVRGTTEVLAGTSATFLSQGLCTGWFNPLTPTPAFPPRISCSTDGKQFLLEKSALSTTQPNPFTYLYKVPFPRRLEPQTHLISLPEVRNLKSRQLRGWLHLGLEGKLWPLPLVSLLLVTGHLWSCSAYRRILVVKSKGCAPSLPG